ncbi:hypothetical protein [Jeotgalibacillus campisalis]|uniref:Transposase n=1 Tax=Jeotgalibacillus campisalis TaxID=220754 RepID=A0A0C2WAA7_9BACL|nr:hypothetical protein [Jeotgalibacillus campisalis]KIL52988.1 hypothetical protein KR50_03170 [Jeotgalibacillus campisalis]
MSTNSILTQQQFLELLVTCLQKGNHETSLSLQSMVKEIEYRMLINGATQLKQTN